MKQIAPNYTYNKTTGVIQINGLIINRSQLLLIVNTTRNVTYYNFADSATKLQTFSIPSLETGTQITLNSSVVSASSAHDNYDSLVIYYDDNSQVTNELPYIRLNINVTDANSSTIVSNIILRRIGEYSYESLRYQGGEDEAYLKVYLDNGTNGQNGATIRRWYISSHGSMADVQGVVASAYAPNRNSNNGDTLPPTTAWSLATGFTGYVEISYVQPENTGWELIARRNWAQDQSSLPIPNVLEYTELMLVLESDGSTDTVISSWYYGRSDLAWVWDGQTNLNFNSNRAYFAKIQYPSLVFTMDNLDCCEQYEFKLYGKRSSSSGITDTELRASPIVVKQEKASSGVYKSNFTTTTPSSLIGTSTYQNVRKAFTVFNEGPANLYIGVGSPTTTTEYQVRLSAGDYWECPAVQIGILHTAVFSSAGTARVVEVW